MDNVFNLIIDKQGFVYFCINLSIIATQILCRFASNKIIPVAVATFRR